MKQKIKTKLMVDLDRFPGLREKLGGFNPCNLLTFIQDPGFGYSHVYLFKLEFLRDGKYGLCIWDSRKQDFIEEPSDLDDYGLKSVQALHKKYPGLRK